jgi:transposase-like protein
MTGCSMNRARVREQYHQISKKHLAKYINEFTFRLNEGNVKRHSLERLDSMVTAIVGKRLTFAGLTA